MNATIAFCIIMALVIVFVGLLLLGTELAERSDTYKGVRNFSRIVRDEMQQRWLHSRCLTGHGGFCSSCRKREQCYKELEEQMKRVIDAEQELENNKEVK